MSTYVHPSSIVDEGASIGENSKIWHFCHIESSAIIGDNCSLGQNVYMGKNTKMGNNCKLQNNVSLYEGVILHDYVFCGPSSVFTNDLTPRAKYPKGSANFVKTHVLEGVSIGANATIVCGNTIGKHAMIGAGAVVTCDVPAHALMLGVPATVKGYVCNCGMRLNFIDNKSCCTSCKRSFIKTSNGIEKNKGISEN